MRSRSPDCGEASRSTGSSGSRRTRGAKTGSSPAPAEASMAAGRTNLPFFAKPRQADNWFGLTPYRSATEFTVAPGANVSATTCAFTSSGHRRCPDAWTSTPSDLRNEFIAHIAKRTPHLEMGRSRNHADARQRGPQPPLTRNQQMSDHRFRHCSALEGNSSRPVPCRGEDVISQSIRRTHRRKIPASEAAEIHVCAALMTRFLAVGATVILRVT
ncbi:hypothetical protein JSE7799_01349 [Jannaschia seosinensis]|uniref:Uncharacterized protein n=1 Tax=Jannaschia seosinensis TaxID=313367 RepID=A0A0M7B9L4_9RHOB|nr:hypothetical protein JSE7799_01349 [Jannaschia seosinensis]